MQCPRVLILCATEFEAAGFLGEFPQARKVKLRSGGCLFKGDGWHCLITGPGVFNTALGLGAYLECNTPELILDTGIAGAFEGAGLKPGDIAVAAREQYLHTGVGNDALSRSPLPFELIPDCPKTAGGIYDIDPELVLYWQARMAHSVKGEFGIVPRVVTGPFLTVSAITRGRERAVRLYGRFSPVMESMEGAAAVHCAIRFAIPVVEIRAASNLVGVRDKSKWDFPLACDRVRRICRSVAASASTELQ